jgi:Fe2+ transport system protein B
MAKMSADRPNESELSLPDPGAMEVHYPSRRDHLDILKNGVCAGTYKGWLGFLWMLKILIPVSFLTTLLEWSGWLKHLEFAIQPVMGLLSLPAMAALPLIIGMLTSVYGGMAAMIVLPFSKEQMTLMAIFLLIAHNLIQEGIIQGKSGLHPVKATIFRLIAAFITVFAVAQFMETGPIATTLSPGSTVEVYRSFITAVSDWAFAMLYLSFKIFFIIMVIMVLLETLKALGWINQLVRILMPFLRALGLSPRVGMLWMTAVVFGLAYGAAVIVEEAKRGDLSSQELEELQLSIGINHSMVEDPALFLSLGLSAFWLWVPRLITAIVAVRLLTLWQSMRLKLGYLR